MKLKFNSLTHQRLYRNPARIVATCLGATVCVAAPALAQTTTTDWWQQIEKADARVTACRATWKRVATTKAQHRKDEAKQITRAKAQVQQQGGRAEDIQNAEDSIRTYLQRQAKGYTQKQTLAFTRVNNTILCDVLSGAPLVAANAPDPTVAHYIDFYDGKNAIAMAAVGAEMPDRGQLTRDKSEVLSHSAPGLTDLQFLTGAPITQEFSQKNSSLREAPDRTLILEKRIKTPRLYLLRLTLSKEHLRPVAFDAIDESFVPDNVVKMRRTATGYRRYANDVWFPSKITTDRGFGSEEDTLVTAAFNETVDEMELRLPPGTLIADARFGDKKTVGYKLENGKLRSDQEVQNLLEEKKNLGEQGQKAEKVADTTQPNAPASPVTPVAGLVFMAIGGMMWVRSSRNNNA